VRDGYEVAVALLERELEGGAASSDVAVEQDAEHPRLRDRVGKNPTGGCVVAALVRRVRVAQQLAGRAFEPLVPSRSRPANPSTLLASTRSM
jgi:hypothetical protein